VSVAHTCCGRRPFERRFHDPLGRVRRAIGTDVEHEPCEAVPTINVSILPGNINITLPRNAKADPKWKHIHHQVPLPGFGPHGQALVFTNRPSVRRSESPCPPTLISESFDDELFTCLSLEEVVKLAQVLGVSPLSLVAGDDSAHGVTGEMPLRDVISRVREHIVLHALTPVAFSDRVGWDISEALLDPDSAWHSWNLDWLYDVCAELKIDWMAVLRARPPQAG
jgi:hypothetical protein